MSPVRRVLAALAGASVLLTSPTFAQPAKGSSQATASRMLRTVAIEHLKRLPSEGSADASEVYLEFWTGRPGVSVPPEIRACYPDGVTVVLQYNYSDLEVGEDAVRVTLSFREKPWSVVIPYDAVYAFQDTDIRIALPFMTPKDETDDEGAKTPLKIPDGCQ